MHWQVREKNVGKNRKFLWQAEGKEMNRLRREGETARGSTECEGESVYVC